ncbi:MAG: GNAT family N-acetyltransferase [Pseudomonadota bacterium]
MAEFRLETDRLLMRGWREGDFAALHALCTDPAVMATIGPLHDEAKTGALLLRLQEREARDGCTFWALERKSDARVIGFCGIALGTVPAIAGQLEIGWRLASDCWGQSFAREAAQGSLVWAARVHPDQAVWAITAVGNLRSRGLMERLGMRYCAGMDFDHPLVAPDSPLLPHVTYVLDAAP